MLRLHLVPALALTATGVRIGIQLDVARPLGDGYFLLFERRVDGTWAKHLT